MKNNGIISRDMGLDTGKVSIKACECIEKL